MKTTKLLFIAIGLLSANNSSAHYEDSPYVYCHNNPVNAIDPDGNDAVLIVFPDYSINLHHDPEVNINFVGHAGVLLIDNKSGATSYYEYGRYQTSDNTSGRVRTIPVPKVTIGSNGRPTTESLNKVFGVLSKKAGQSGRIDGAYIISNEYAKMNSYAKSKFNENNSYKGNKSYNKNREPYSLFSNNCGTFAADVINQDESVDQPWIVNPAPVNIVDEYQEEGNAQVTYNPNTNTTVIGKGDEKDAKIHK